MENSQNEEQPIRWMLHFFTFGILGWAFIEGYQIYHTGNEDLYAEYLFHLVLLQGVYGAFLILGSATYPIMRGLLEQKLDISEEDSTSRVAFLFGLALIGAAYAVYEGWEYGLFTDNTSLLLLINATVFTSLSRPAAAHVIYRMGFWWFLLSLAVMLFAICYKRDE